MQKRARARAAAGQGLVEGVVGLVILIIGVVLAVLLLVNAGVSAFYKSRIGFITQQAADFASQKQGDKDVLEAFTKSLLKESGLPEMNSLEVENITVADQDAVRVKLTVQGLTLVGNGEILPKQINIEDVAVKTVQGGAHNGDAVLSIVRSGNQFAYVVPAKKVDLNKGRLGGDLISGANLADKLNPNSPLMLIQAVTDPNGGGETGLVNVNFQNDGIKTLAGFDKLKPVPATL